MPSEARIQSLGLTGILLLASCTVASPTPSPSVAPTVPGSAQGSGSPGCAGGPVACFDLSLAAAFDDAPFGAVVAVDRAGERVFERAYGTQADGDPYAIDTPFEIASIGKMFTAVAIGQLVDREDLRFDDSVGPYVDGLTADVGAVTIGQLLSHTAGLGEALDEGIVAPAGSFAYTNAGFDLLARVVESVSGEPFESYLEANIFEPAGMSSTILTTDRPAGDPQGWGGETSTAPDLLRFASALIENRLLSADTTALLMAPKVDTDHGAYGYGFEIPCTETPHECAGHFGVDGQFIGFVEISTDLGYSIVALCDSACDSMGPAIVEFADALGISI